MDSIEILGWFATSLVLASFMFKDMFKLRFTNLMSAIAWAIYALLQKDNPLIVVNLLIISIHLLWFYKNRKLWKS